MLTEEIVREIIEEKFPELKIKSHRTEIPHRVYTAQ